MAIMGVQRDRETEGTPPRRERVGRPAIQALMRLTRGAGATMDARPGHATPSLDGEGDAAQHPHADGYRRAL